MTLPNFTKNDKMFTTVFQVVWLEKGNVLDKFVLRVPEWQGELLFTGELLVFVGVIILMLVGVLFCFWGYKYFRTVLFLGIGTVVCYVSFLLIEPMTGNLVIRMFLTVSMTFLGICIVYFLDIIWGYFLDGLRLRSMFGKNIYLIAAPLGAVIIGMTIYWFIWRGPAAAVVTAVACGTGGLIFQHFRGEKAVRFKCYNDLLRIPRPKVNADGLEYIVMEPVAAAGTDVAAVSEPVPESEQTAEPVPVAAAGPELVSDPVPEAEPESVAAVVPEPVPEVGPTAESEPVAAVVSELVSEPEPEPVAAAVPEPASEPEPIAEIEIVEAEPEPDILEDALFVRQMNEYLKNGRLLKQIDIELAAMAAGRHAEAVTAAQREAADVMNKAAAAMNKAAVAIDRATAAAPQPNVLAGRRRKPHGKQTNRLAKGAAVAAAGIGLFIAGRASKGRD